jgi:hypothetical protein
MNEFLKRAWANPSTTFLGAGAILTLLSVDLADGQPFTAAKAARIGASIVGILASMAARDSGRPGGPPPGAGVVAVGAAA